MKIQSIDKPIYRKKLNIVSTAFIAVFAVLSLIFGSIIIAILGGDISTANAAVDAEVQSNFRYNLAGVVIALVTMAMIANMMKGHVYVKEIYYVWRLKQLHNRIYRKLVKIKGGQASDDDTVSANAKTILAFYYTTLKQVYELDNNTLTITKVNADIEKIKQQIGEDIFEQTIERFDKSLLDSF